jgi:hypothetical protein
MVYRRWIIWLLVAAAAVALILLVVAGLVVLELVLGSLLFLEPHIQLL